MWVVGKDGRNGHISGEDGDGGGGGGGGGEDCGWWRS